MKLTFLGTGTSFGVPQLGCGCAVCRSTDPRDKRTRVGAAVETDGGAVLLIDTPTELRLQLLAHAHHARGRGAVHASPRRSHPRHRRPARDHRAARHASADVRRAPTRWPAWSSKFNYIFDDRIQPLPGTSKPQGRTIPLAPGVPTRIADVDVTAVPVPHGRDTIYAYRIGPLAYVTDAKSVPESAIELLRGARVLVINALFRVPHPSHLSFDEAIAAARAIGAERHVPDASHARQLPRRPRSRAAARHRAGVRRPHHSGLTMTIRLDYTNMMAPPIDGGITRIRMARGRRRASRTRTAASRTSMRAERSASSTCPTIARCTSRRSTTCGA